MVPHRGAQAWPTTQVKNAWNYSMVVPTAIKPVHHMARFCCALGSVLQAFWPAKLAAFEARQLHAIVQHALPGPPGLCPSQQLLVRQTLAHHLMRASPISAYCVSKDLVNIQHTEINPDKDVMPTGGCLLAKDHGGIIAIYNAHEAWQAALPHATVSFLAQSASHLIFESAIKSFAAAVCGLLHMPKHAIKTDTASNLF